MAKLSTCLLFFVLSAPNCISAKQFTNADDAAVLSIIVQSMCESLVAHGESGYIVLSDQADEIKSDGGKDGLNRDALSSLVERNSVSQPLPKIKLCVSVKVFRRNDILAVEKRFGAEDFMSNFQQAFPGSRGVATLSLPGYADEGRSALVVMSNGGGSFYYILRKVAGSWSIERSVFRSIA